MKAFDEESHNLDGRLFPDPKNPLRNQVIFPVTPANKIIKVRKTPQTATPRVGSANATHVDLRPRLIKFMEEHNPAKVRDVDDWLTRYEDVEEKLIQRLEKQYG